MIKFYIAEPMTDNKFKNKLEVLLKKDSRLVDENKELNLAAIRDLTDKTDSKLIELLLSDAETTKKFFLKVKDVSIFKQNDFKFFLDANQIDNSYTAYENRIGLASGNRLLKDSSDVVLNFPFKDCVLEGGQSTEEGTDQYYEYKDESKNYEIEKGQRKEIFFNEILAQDEIDRLFEPKAFANVKKHTTQGEEKVKKFTRDKNGTITDNLIIKGNNLLALHSLKEEFTGKVKLIYIDPPYNTGNDSFKYNDSFNQSSWLTFMKNRLEIANELLKDDGAIFVQIDHHELAYLSLILDEVFGKENRVQIIAVKVASPSGFKAVNPGPIDVTEYILFYTKNKSAFEFKRNYVPAEYHSNYNLFLDQPTKDISTWTFIPVKQKVLEVNGFESEKEAKEKFGVAFPVIIKSMIADFAFNNSTNVVSIRDLHKPTDKVRQLQNESRKNGGQILSYKKVDGDFMYLYKGGALAFYSNKIEVIDGKPQVIELLSDFWEHISWAGIAQEGGVRLKNGKKPEKLIKQIMDIVTKEGDIVLDFHLGSGTTVAAAHKYKRQYIGIEQLDYGDNDSKIRLQNIINGDKSGISKNVKWEGGGSFVYVELAKWNEEAKEKIAKCNSLKELEKLLTELSEKYFLHYNVKFKEFKEKIIHEDNFKKLPLKKQQEMFSKMLDLNQLYVNASEMEDKKFGLNKEDIALTKNFYNL